MKTTFATLAFLSIPLLGVQAGLVWPVEHKVPFFKHVPEIENVRAPDGFTVTPAEVSAMFDPRQFRIMIYASDSHYFVTRHSRKMSYKKAQMFGVSINGRTGTVYKQGLGLKALRTYEEVKEEK